MIDPAPTTAPSRMCAWRQMRQPVPIVALGETSAVGWACASVTSTVELAPLLLTMCATPCCAVSQCAVSLPVARRPLSSACVGQMADAHPLPTTDAECTGKRPMLKQQAIWNGTDAESYDLLASVQRHCECE